MNKREIEDLYIQSLDRTLSDAEQKKLAAAVAEDGGFAGSLAAYKVARGILRVREPASFGPFFAAKIINKIQNTGVAIDRQIFGLFKKMQLAAVGLIVALMILNLIFAQEATWKAALGLHTFTATEEQAAPFNFSETLTNLK